MVTDEDKAVYCLAVTIASAKQSHKMWLEYLGWFIHYGKVEMLYPEESHIDGKRWRGGANHSDTFQQLRHFSGIPAFFHTIGEQIIAIFLVTTQFVADTQEVYSLLLELWAYLIHSTIGIGCNQYVSPFFQQFLL